MATNTLIAYKHRRIGGRNGKMQLAHHTVWESANGTIAQGMIIHHKDHNKQNNDLENLQLVTAAEHRKIHSKFMVLLGGKWVKFCKYCKIAGAKQRAAICDSCRARMARIERRSNNGT